MDWEATLFDRYGLDLDDQRGADGAGVADFPHPTFLAGGDEGVRAGPGPDDLEEAPCRRLLGEAHDAAVLTVGPGDQQVAVANEPDVGLELRSRLRRAGLPARAEEGHVGRQLEQGALLERERRGRGRLVGHGNPPEMLALTPTAV